MTDRHLGDDARWLCHHETGSMESFPGTEAQHQFPHRRIVGNTLTVLKRIDQARRGHHLEALVDANKEFGWNGRNLDSAELSAFDLPRNRTQLARGINLALDAAAGVALYRRCEVLGELMRSVIDGRQRDLHYVGLIFGPCRTLCQHKR